MYPHRIRLRGPWTCEPLYHFVAAAEGGWQRSFANLPPPFRTTLPGRWADAAFGGFRGGLCCVRPFGYPGRIDSVERVWLTFTGWQGRATVTLNRKVLGSIEGDGGPAEFAITALLRPRNILSVEVELAEPAGGLWGEVALEVRATAFLRDVCFECQSDQLTARGLVVGEAPRLLELYLFAGDRFLTYDRAQPGLAGQPFALVGDLAGQKWPSPLAVRVELIDTAVIWDVATGSANGPQSKVAPGSS